VVSLIVPLISGGDIMKVFNHGTTLSLYYGGAWNVELQSYQKEEFKNSCWLTVSTSNTSHCLPL
jgi:hypothetical protein